MIHLTNLLYGLYHKPVHTANAYLPIDVLKRKARIMAAIEVGTKYKCTHSQPMSTGKHFAARAAHCTSWRHIGLSDIYRPKFRP
jgi:hypothetical protein